MTLAPADAEQCQQALADYNDAIVAVHAAIHDYERCMTASLARDDCGPEHLALQVSNGIFEAAVDERRERAVREEHGRRNRATWHLWRRL